MDGRVTDLMLSVWHLAGLNSLLERERSVNECEWEYTGLLSSFEHVCSLYSLLPRVKIIYILKHVPRSRLSWCISYIIEENYTQGAVAVSFTATYIFIFEVWGDGAENSALPKLRTGLADIILQVTYAFTWKNCILKGETSSLCNIQHRSSGLIFSAQQSQPIVLNYLWWLCDGLNYAVGNEQGPSI